MRNRDHAVENDSEFRTWVVFTIDMSSGRGDQYATVKYIFTRSIFVIGSASAELKR